MLSLLSFAPWLLLRLNKLIARVRIPLPRFGPTVASGRMLSGSDVRNAGASGSIGTGGVDVDGRWLSNSSRDLRPAASNALLVPALSNRGVCGRFGRSCVESFLDAIHFVFVISSRATGSTGTSGCWNATLTHPRQFRPEGMNWSTSSSNCRKRG